MATYESLFKRARVILKSRYDIDLAPEHWLMLEDWLCNQTSEITSHKTSKAQLIPQLEMIRRQNPTKFYLLEQDTIKELRRKISFKKTPIRKPKIILDLPDKQTDDNDSSGGFIKKKPKDDDDDDEGERDDRTGLIYR